MTRPTNTSMLTVATGLALIVAAALGSATDNARADAPSTAPTAAYAGQPTFRTAPPTRTVAVLDVTESHRLPMGRLAVTFNDGATYDVRACRFEDGHRCWWDAANVGNHRGLTFVSLRGKVTYLR